MSKNTKHSKTLEEMESDEDDTLEYVAPQPVTKQTRQKKQSIPEQFATELPSNLASNLAYNIPPKIKKPRKPLSDEQKQILVERLALARQKKKEIDDAMKSVKAEEAAAHLAQKQMRILEQARLIKKKQKNELKAIENTPVEPLVKAKKPKVVYVEEEDESSEEEEIIVKKPKKKNTNKAPVVPPTPSPVQQSQFQFRFL